VMSLLLDTRVGLVVEGLTLWRWGKVRALLNLGFEITGRERG
jgi:hypothetical protein